MTEEELKKRRILVKGTSPPMVSSPKTVVRRDVNITTPEEDESFKFDDFFGFEEELSEMESARSQYEKMEKQKLLQEKLTESSFDASISNDDFSEDNKPESEPSFIIIDLDDEKSSSSETTGFITFDLDNEENVGGDSTKPVFKQCIFEKEDGERCKRQAPKTSEYCKVHRDK